ncbi:MAG: NAD(P) transhydrogenase subunit alpha [Planctomycetota bacterium]|jgi:NAD(P) transhydrogenase subunit alpha
MRISALNETGSGDLRCAVTPESARKLLGMDGIELCVESGLGSGANLHDDAFRDAGCEVLDDRVSMLSSSDVLLGVAPPDEGDVAIMREGSVYIGFCDVKRDPSLADRFASRGVSVLSLECLPRTTLAQSIDALSSQHSLAGYAMVLAAGAQFRKILPMMITPSGTLAPARVLVIGAGVAGLQAIATAKRLGARVEAFDVRPETKEQCESLGARFVDVDLGDTGGEGGYAGALTEEQRAKQQAALTSRVAASDIVITTAAVPGRQAPRIIMSEMIEPMRAGSVIVDYGAPTGGNVEGSRAGETVVTDTGVSIIGVGFPLNDVATDASRMYASNLVSLFEYTDSVLEEGVFDLLRLLEADDPLVKPCLAVHKGQLVEGASS